ncbi:FHA domain-containing protein [Pedosphaera parvula]|uniref:FHA domain containing protein n=1 Tax=Pedosphaera parvula (strain Ellin514) TaxID=320771 RepID=B9XKW3_PEDPL|nr:FHA domain-containing protein [Pedosphaera parvula]EEF59457.1 FHA domain containing protein [Pedosphaera parvula Ellin514]
MAKLVVLSEGLTGQSFDLKVDKTTIGRVEDNAFQIAQPSVSSHHCEILLKGNEVVVVDLNSTNGTFINGKQIAGEAVLKPGQTLRLGQVDLRLDDGTGVVTPAAAPAAAAKKKVDSTMVVPKGVSMEQLEQGGQTGFDSGKTGFSKKDNKTNKYFVIGGVVFGVIIVGILLVVLLSIGKK